MVINLLNFLRIAKIFIYSHFSGVQAHALRTRFQKCIEGRIFFQRHAFSYKQVPRFLQLQRQYHRYDNNLCAAQMMSDNHMPLGNIRGAKKEITITKRAMH
ncbi:hypothetical protein BpHYR1_023150 [Brachionus plicatilis]|uniref:Uncharacterized protein n=1 Tax=Brachionus plicatilis TaxID=10195 RepID=A0A3M7S8U4_BRAPC|nr:hypothetical protein BpHYR1_023150 [Brachionus plicatilis]